MTSGGGQFRLSQGRFKNLEEAFFLADNGLALDQLQLDRKPRPRVRETKHPIASGELDQVDLNLSAINHAFLFSQSQKIAKYGSSFRLMRPPIVRRLHRLHARNRLH